MTHFVVPPFKIRLFFSVFILLVTASAAFGQQTDSAAVADSLLIQELERELAGTTQADTPTQAVSRSTPSTNPNISVIGDIRGSYISEGERNIDGGLHEAEFSFKSFVDPYARADVFVSAHNHEGEIEFEMEEAYLTSTSLPYQLQLKAGKFRSVFGKINLIHPHALPFIDTPAIYANYLGEEGLNDAGVSLSWLVPNPSFYQELTVEVTRGPEENESFAAAENNRLLYVGHLKNFWDLTDNATLELGLSGATGRNGAGFTTQLGGLDLTYIWKPRQFNTYTSFTLQAEAFYSRNEVDLNETITTQGLYLMANYQLARRWFLVGRFDHSDLPDDPDWNEQGVSLTLGWHATEFQKLELGLRTSTSDAFDRNYQVVLRSIFVIGTHAAHTY